ncbi:hypothetical protein P3T37_001701 [Kitasatospora sp. MAA4]|uniref:ATP-binding protein n=1 Tax=Kitasatospora sp. MAA4 TaxID=3035093 RepID=UPI0024762F9F|nr:DUF87 domain-containing protein [Kitasatospora sp. MAA4]MDH6132316.1 hypothetical protein [Kitasatospora sp. MAA4]
MAVEDLMAEALDYLQRVGFEPPLVRVGAAVTQSPPDLRTLVRVAGIGCLDKAPSRSDAERADPLMQDLLVGLYHYKVPLAFRVGGGPGRVSVSIGTWLPVGSPPQSVQGNGRLLETALRSLYPAVDLQAEEPATGFWPVGGLVTGIPTLKSPDETDGARQLDRLFRALSRSPWAALVLAQPVDESPVHALRLSLINEMRAVQSAAKAGSSSAPLAEHYTALLTRQLDHFTDAQGIGAWRTSVYLLGDAEGYPEAASLWRAVFSGAHSVPEPVRVWDREEVPELAAAWAMADPLAEATAPPGLYRQPFQHQTLLTSRQLAAYVHFPAEETNGFAVTVVPDFDAVPPPADSRTAVLGTIVEHQRVTGVEYGIDPDKLTRHAFVTGVTGSGKTNTVFHLLREISGRGIPFLVLEPAKTEYRSLLRDQALGAQLQVFTLGDETTSPFRLNPFEVPPGIPVAVHLDLLRSVFHASFGMWTPLPQVLEISLHEVYADCGWDVTSNTNRRLNGSDGAEDRSVAFPTLGDLLRKVEEVVPRLGYEEKVTGDLRAALSTRLNSLRAGGKGRMLDVQRSLPIDLLLAGPSVLELENLGDDDDKAFLMGLLIIRLAEFRRTQGESDGLRHLLVVEEAHRLLTNAARPSGGEGAEADVRGKAVETFTGLLSEIRAYGQGVLIVDQVPTKLASDVLKNTNLKVAHRLVSGEDRGVLGDAMVMTSRQDTALATLPTGRAAVFTEGEDAPLLLQVPPSKAPAGRTPSDSEVREHMLRSGLGTSADLAQLLLPSRGCDRRCLEVPAACERARALVLEPTVARSFARLVLSAVQSPGGLERTWPDLAATVDPLRPPWLDRTALLDRVARHAVQQFADSRGARAGWSYQQTAEVAELLDRVLTAQFQGHPTGEEVARLRSRLLVLRGERYGPFQGCARIWQERPNPCLCADPVAELVAAGGFAGVWAQARESDRAPDVDGRPAVWDVCRDAAYHLVEYPAQDQDPELATRLRDIADCTALCFAQQMFAAEDWSHPATGRRALTDLLTMADRDEDSPLEGEEDA